MGRRLRWPASLIVADAEGRPLLRVGRPRPVDDPDTHDRDDTLTGLATGATFRASVRREFARIRRGGAAGCVASLDMDDLKFVNDTHGHRVGDQLLREVAALLTTSLREGDLVARTGGDEFGVLLPDTSIQHAVDVLERFSATLRTEVPGPDDAGVSVSVGLARLDDTVRTADDALRHADNAVHVAKTKTRGGVSVATKGMFSELRKEWVSLAHAAAVDERTALPNAASFTRDWAEVHAQALHEGSSYALLIVDVDHFHGFNRAHGMRAGDAALHDVARALESVTLPHHTYRYGGEEFTVLVPGVNDVDVVARLGADLLDTVRSLRLPHRGRPDEHDMVTVTIAGTVVDATVEHRAAAFDRVDAGLRRGKATGRDRYVET